MTVGNLDTHYWPSGLPKGFEEVNFAHFKQSLMKLWGQVRGVVCIHVCTNTYIYT